MKHKHSGVLCDYCGRRLPCRAGSAEAEHYWTLRLGTCACAKCLLLVADDHQEIDNDHDRSLVLRLLHANHPEPWGGINLPALDTEIEKIRGSILAETVALIDAQRQRISDLHTNGRLIETMEAARTLFAFVSCGHSMVGLFPLMKTGHKVRRPFEVARLRSRESANNRRAEWQRRADEKWSDPRHAAKSATAIARLIAQLDENPNTIRKAIKK